jgi:serine phosphatase RsbU (regulator of sigma subunit)
MRSRHGEAGGEHRELHGRSAVFLSRLAPGRRPILLAVVGVLLILVVAQSALAGLSRVGAEDRKAAALSHAARAHQDADMAHDALHADVSRLMTRAPDSSIAQSRAAAEQDLAQYRRSLEILAGTPSLPAEVAPDLERLIAQEREYMLVAEQLAAGPMPRRSAVRQSLVPFDRSFAALTAPMGAFTDRLVWLQEAAGARSERAHQAANRRVAAAAVVAVLIMLALIRWLTRMTARLAQHEVQREVATTLQRSLLPAALPSHPGARCAARYLPTSAGVEVGGDWYDAFELPDGTLALVMGDVTGHDVQAAGVMGKLRSALRAYALDGYGPGEVLTRLNQFVTMLHPNVMATCVYAIYAAEQATLTWTSAGHFPPLLAVPGQPAGYLQAHSAQLPIGALANSEYTDTVHMLPPGSRLLLFTDGLIERRGADLEDGMNELAEAARHAPPGAEALCAHLLDVCLPDGTAADDVALLAMETEPQDAPPERHDGLARGRQARWELSETQPGGQNSPSARR